VSPRRPLLELFPEPLLLPAAKELAMTITTFRTQAPVVVDEDKCIAEKGCTVCVDVCPLDVLAIDLTKNKAFMKFDECWYCMPCEKDCPTGAVHVNIPYLVR
jgi:NAD-dependent dihydropyrimidine dehydrogenase PreA subunit